MDYFEVVKIAFEREPDIRLGFTGTQRGMAHAQGVKLGEIFLKIYQEWMDRVISLHHGDDKGADREAHQLARHRAFRTVVHPPIDARRRAFCAGDEVREPDGYIERNHRIVDETRLLIATPKLLREEQRSGTWATVRYARRRFVPVLVIWTNGSVTVQ